MRVTRLPVYFRPDIKRVMLRPFFPTTEERAYKIVRRILSLPQSEVERELQTVLDEFTERHRHLESFYLDRFEQLHRYIPVAVPLTASQRLLIGAYFSCEYSLEAAALFNPSLIWHPDQTGLPSGSKRFIISLRATGEGHISSLAFRSGCIHSEQSVIMDECGRFVNTAHITPKNGGYDAEFVEDIALSERVLFPNIPEESNGIEDARFVEFQQENGSTRYFATYTAYDGKAIHSMLLETEDFLRFKIRKLKGTEVHNKGLALFPRKIEGRYVMLSRQDNENNYIMFSDRIDQWERKTPLMEPQYSWEYFQIGNCGSPIETSVGWLVLGHAVGAMRKYVLSAFLLDLRDPTRVIGRLNKPLLSPDNNEREGYVPNVVYTCGGQLWQNKLFIPYAMSDYACSFAMADVDELLNELAL